MILPDVNVIVDAHREDAARHAAAYAVLEQAVERGERIALAQAVIVGALRILTHPSIWVPPTPLDVALHQLGDLVGSPHVVAALPRATHWQTLSRLCAAADARGNRVPDAHLAALAIDSGAELVSADHGFARYPGLRFRPL